MSNYNSWSGVSSLIIRWSLITTASACGGGGIFTAAQPDASDDGSPDGDLTIVVGGPGGAKGSTDASTGIDVVGSATSDGGDGGLEAATSCGDVSGSDARNCGRCGHDCLGGACLQGTCQSWIVAQPPVTSAPSAIVSDGQHVVWLDTGFSSVLDVPVTGGGPSVTLEHDSNLATSFGEPSLQNGIVAWGATTSLWTATEGQANSGIKRPFTFASGYSVSSTQLNADATHVAVMASSDVLALELYDCALGAATCADIGGLPAGFPHAVANARSLFFTSGGDVHEFDFGETSYGTIASGQSALFLALDATQIYWANFSTTGTITRALQDGGTSTTIASSVSGPIGSLATDGTNVYFTRVPEHIAADGGTVVGDPGYVSSAPTGGCCAFTDLVTGTVPKSVVAAGGALFWIDGAVIYGLRTQ
jgi:hypothetical protein